MVALSGNSAGRAAPPSPDGRQRNSKRPRPLLENVQEDPQAAGDSKFARALGSVDAQTRNQGLTALAAWLSLRNSVSEPEMSKIWKGLFYCFWHSDKQPVQKHLAERLAEIILDLQPEVAVMYFRVFLKTMQREWFGIDRLRLDKFMLLVRCFIGQAASRLCTFKWDVAAVQDQAACIWEEVLGRGGSATNLAAGLGYHLADVFVTETSAACEHFGSSGGCPSNAGLRAWLEPFCQTLAACDRAAFLPRLQDGVFGKLLRAVREGDAWIQKLEVPALAAHLFSIGAQPGIKSRNRAVLYDISNQLKNASSKRPRTLLPAGTAPTSNGKLSVQPPASFLAAASLHGHSSQSPALNGNAAPGSKRKKGKFVTGSSAQAVPMADPSDTAAPAPASEAAAGSAARLASDPAAEAAVTAASDIAVQTAAEQAADTPTAGANASAEQPTAEASQQHGGVSANEVIASDGPSSSTRKQRKHKAAVAATADGASTPDANVMLQSQGLEATGPAGPSGSTRKQRKQKAAAAALNGASTPVANGVPQSEGLEGASAASALAGPSGSTRKQRRHKAAAVPATANGASTPVAMSMIQSQGLDGLPDMTAASEPVPENGSMEDGAAAVGPWPDAEAIRAAVSAVMGSKKKQKKTQQPGLPNGVASSDHGREQQPSSPSSGAERLQRAASLEQEAVMATPGSDAEAVQEASAAGTALPSALHSPSQAAATPPSSPRPAPATPDSALQKKLRFSLQRNLYHASKGPVPPPEIRTPPNLRPKGSAIKKSATVDVVSRKKSRLGRLPPATGTKKPKRQPRQLWQ